MIEPVRWDSGTLLLLDQTVLPDEERWVELREPRAVADAIRAMLVRGAPAIGVAAAYGMALAAREAVEREPGEFLAHLGESGQVLEAARPTAVNLAWAVRRIRGVAERALQDGVPVAQVVQRLEAEADAIREEDLEANRTMGRHGSLLVPDGARVLTHCNAGALATSGYGTALGVVRAAVEEGKSVFVLADETRPFLQGARLTAWELQKDGIPVTLIADSMAGALMARGEVDLVVVGADRIARNGDVANKIGTYTVAVMARRHGIPFYVAAPLSTIDPDCPDGAAIPIEERDPGEVTHVRGVRLAPEGVAARHPAFDVTPAELVSAIITEKGIHRPPFRVSIGRALGLEPEPEVVPQAVAEPAPQPSRTDVPAADPDEEDLFA
ncbi:MAG: S-methyl-5-thioribose-1-phosphate isomerase [Acidobacteria bacterium]|nr:S-methyl-5-thioribose-1-phosphate isomerase [Acidobacteriota bacterium]